MRRDTPSLLRLFQISTLVLGLALCLTGTWSVHDRDAAVADAVDSAEPLSASAESLYRSLSDADVTAATIFLSGSSATGAEQRQYAADIAAVAGGLSAVGREPGAPGPVRSALGVIEAEVPVYTGLISTAQTDDRLGFPVAGAYLREASVLLHGRLLPAAEEVYQAAAARLAGDDAAAASIPVVQLALLVAALAVLVVGQVYLARRTKRLLNPGLVAATLLLLIVAVWAGAGMLGAHSAAGKGQRDGSVAVDALARARLAASQTHDDEVLSLASNGEDSGAYAQDFAHDSASAKRLLAAAQALPLDPAARAPAAAAANAQSAWFADHARLQTAQDTPQPDNNAYLQELAQVTAVDGDTSGAAYRSVDGDLNQAVTVERDRYLSDLHAAGSDLSGLATGTALLTALAALAGAVGVDRRLREYR